MNTYLWINGIFFTIFGAGFLIAPQTLSAFLTKAPAASSRSLVNMRALYGGMCLGIGNFLIYTALSHGAGFLGVTAAVLIMSGISVGRAAGIILDRGASVVMLATLSVELTSAIAGGMILANNN
jgi:hypothetical protein